ncbi:alanine--tRNA ligase-related protein [Pseudonocardia sp. RS11V-5]|uniref:alanine--tRNA ligase-related protein n=1 Tax=Pseudonocardia terrae TaxID=2905831 RepID=UPI001E4205F3|nr:alanine--tRNA ligase-related protein [Pseudonocardia terrae]MCE3552947.1 alanine--tRNA ligase-related protein [Pseudonocardia terrae]
MDAQDIRRAFLDMLRQDGHAVVTRAPIVLRDDPTTLFTGSGMQPLLPYLLGAEHPQGARLADVQPCLRAQDMDEVGDNRHTTFFEMLGNWSLGDYGKAEQIPRVFRFLVDVVGLDPNRLYVTCFLGDPVHGVPRDEESAEIWERLFAERGIECRRIDLGTEEYGNEHGNQGARIAFYGDKNWWSRFGAPDDMPVGDPGGPDSEVFYYFPQVEHDTRYGRFPHQNSDGGQYLEIGNSVFMTFRRTETGVAELPKHNVDFGGGLERIAAASLDDPDVYRVSLLWPIVEKLQQMSGKAYDGGAPEIVHAMRVVADHLRGAAFLAADGVKPGNSKQGYVMRRLVRRALRFGLELELTEGVAVELVPIVGKLFADVYPEVAEQEERIVAVLQKEERQFARTLRKGLSMLRRLHRQGEVVTGEHLFELHDTFGMPLELSLEEAERKGYALAADWRPVFDGLMEAQRDRSRAAV